MKTKRILRWGIVLFLLAVLPVMTVALAQDGAAGESAFTGGDGTKRVGVSVCEPERVRAE
jgi:hypothetical protein